MPKFISLVCLLGLASMVSLPADPHADALQKLAEVANPPLVITMDTAAGSPTVVLTDKGVLINKADTPIPFDQTLSGLAALPKEAWPCGRVVFFSPAPADSSKGAAPPKEISDKVELDLQKANIRLLHVSN